MNRSPITARRTLALLALLALTGVACLPSGGGEDAAGGATGAGGSEPSAAAGEPTGGASAGANEPDRLVVWDIYVRGVEREIAEKLTSEFEEEHGVTVERQPKTLDDLKTTLPLAMQEPTGPDVASVNQGLADMGAMVKAGLLMDLTEYGEQQGWFETFGENLLKRNSFSADGEQFGTGNLYGVAPQAEIVGWFYNRKMFSDQGLQPPQSWDELIEVLDAFKQAGQTPITFGNLDAWPAIHTYGAIEHTYVTTDYLNDLIFHTGDASFDRPENVQAAADLQSWVNKGYFTKNFSGIGYDDSIAQFAAGDGALMLTGTWIAGELGDPRKFGFFLTPGRDGELPPQTGGMGVPLAIRADTKAPELAKAYVAWMTSERAAELWQEAWLPTRTPPAESLEDGTLMADMAAAWQEIRDQEELGHYLDWATPTFYDTLTANLQQLLGGSQAPQAFVQQVAEDYQSAE